MVVRETQHQTSVLTNSIVDSFLFGMSLEQVNWNYLQRLLMGRLQINRTGNPGIGCIQPSLRAYAPSFAGFQAGKAVPRSGSNQIIALLLGEFKEVLGQNTAYHM